MEFTFNKHQTELTDELLNSIPEEVREQLFEIIQTVPFIQHLISKDRKYARDLTRDEKGRIIVDVAHPHILEDMDYFRQPALHYIEHGCYTFLRPNSNPNSEYRKFWDEEIRRMYEGCVRKSDGEWVTGYMYWFLNYNPMMVNFYKEGSKKAVRKESFPLVFEGIYFRFHYLWQARENGHHSIELAKRGCGKSYSLSSIMTHNLILGESKETNRRAITILTAYQKEYLSDSKDGTLSKFKPSLNFIFDNTPLPHLLLKNSPNEMTWQMGYKDDMGREQGSLNQVMAVSAKDDSEKLRGKRGYILFEEMGSFKGLLSLYDITRRSVEDGDFTFAFMYLVGTSAEDESDFTSAKTLLYNPNGYNLQEVENVYDKINQGKKTFGYFFPAYVNRAGCYNKDGVSDVIKALIEVLINRYKMKYSSDPTSVLRTIAEDPITPAEAIIKVKNAYFPTTALTERLTQLDANPNAFDDVYTGNFNLKNGEVEFEITGDIPIRQYGVKNTTKGAVEIFEMPAKDKDGRVYYDRYIIGHDPVDNDQAESSSLSSTIVLDLWTDRIVAEYTGRQLFADENYEIVRMLCLFYNAKCMYEAHPYDQKVITPDGIKLWKDIKVGDMLFTINNQTTKVVDIPIDGEDDIYEITLQDGRKVQASTNHLWYVSYYTNRNKYINLTTRQILEKGIKNNYGQYKFFIQEAGGVSYIKQGVPIDPYTMGLLIAEGEFTKFNLQKNNFRQSNRKRNYIQFSSSKEDGKFYEKTLPYKIKYIGTKGCSWHLYKEDIATDLKNLNLIGKNSYDKCIPDVYMYNDYNTRLELLKGIMDEDGRAVSQGASVFITTSKQLAEDVLLLCRSLGIKANYNKGGNKKQYVSKGNAIKCHESYRIAIHSYIPIFKLPRKLAKQHIYDKYAKGSKARGFIDKNAIVDILYVGKKKCKCVTVDREDGLYLIGDYVVTHNCNKKGLYQYFQKMYSTHLLLETPQYLRDRQLVKYNNFGNNQYGVNASAAINNYSNSLIRDWLLLPKLTIIKKDDGTEIETTVPNLYNIKNRALLEELIAFAPEINVDRVRALGMVMLAREEKMVLWGGTVKKSEYKANTMTEDPFFKDNYDDKFDEGELKSVNGTYDF